MSTFVDPPQNGTRETAPYEHHGTWSTLRDAVRGTHLDYTTAPIGRAVVMLAVPMVLEMAMESIFAVADVFWVAHLGADAVATVGLTESMMTMIYTAAMGLSIGATALVARRTGEHDFEGAARAAGQSIVLGPCFIFGLGPFPRLGVTGAAVATNLGRGAAVIYQFVMLTRGTGRVRLARRHLVLDVAMMRTVLKLSGSGTFQILLGTASYIGLVRILSTFGSDALAGYTIGIRVIIFALLPAFGISNAAATMVGQNLGARQPERAERAVWTAAAYNVLFLGVIGLVFLTAAPQIAALFSSDPNVQPFAI